MKRGPPRAELGLASCPACHDATMRVATNKHGFPAAYCHKCDTQVAPRSERGSLLLLGRIHTWTNREAAELMLTADDREHLAPGDAPKAGQLPPHLARPQPKNTSTPPRPSSPPATPAPAPPTPPKRKSWLDEDL